jgi:hypothetical protein
MSDAVFVKEGDCLDDLEEDLTHESVLAEENLVVDYGVKEVGSRDQFEDEEDKGRSGDDPMKRDDGRMRGDATVEFNLGL